MTNTMTSKGYSARIEYDDGDGVFTGRLAGISDGIGFHTETVETSREAFHEAVEDYVETCAKVGKEPQNAFSGQVMFRVDPAVHRKAALATELSGKSLNQWAEEVLDRTAEYTKTLPASKKLGLFVQKGAIAGECGILGKPESRHSTVLRRRFQKG